MSRVPKCVMIIAGEASGDLHGSNLIKSLKQRDENIFIMGVGGHAMRAAGARILFDAKRLSVVGATEVIAKLPAIFQGLSLVKRALKSVKPDLLILIDFPDFNLMAAKTARALGIPVLYYICPQVWAWRTGRVEKMKKKVDQLAVILPFEEDFYESRGLPATFVGHPLLDTIHLPEDTIEEKEPLCIGLLPGSRSKEISRMFPVMLQAAANLKKSNPGFSFIVSIAPTVDRNMIESMIADHGLGDIKIVSEHVSKVFAECSLVIATSGTVTLEAALYGVPMVIVYKASLLTSWIARLMLKVKYIGLANLIAGKELVPELIQGDANPDNIADIVTEMVFDKEGLEILRRKLLETRNLLGGPGASERTADMAIKMMSQKKRFLLPYEDEDER